MRAISSKRAKACAIPASVKMIVTHRDEGRCIYCGKAGLPEAHFIPRSRGGLGVPQNILTLCRDCHDKFDHGDRATREGMREFFREYLQSHYSDWNENNLIYRRFPNEH